MLKRFFIICSGADTDILKETPLGEHNKYVGIGATIFFTAVMAFIASSYALYTIFDSVVIALGFGLVWGLLIFNLDRFIVSTIKKRGSFLKDSSQAIPRLILAIIIAIVISKPLELKIFEKEINNVLLEQKNELTLANQEQIALQYTPKTRALEQQISVLKEDIKTKEAEVNALYSIYITEAEGTTGTKKLGKGPVYQEKRDKHDAALAALEMLKADNHLKIEGIEKEIALLNTNLINKVQSTQPIIEDFDGLMARITALNTLPWIPSFFIFLLFLVIETTPIFAKLIAPKGPYDYKLEDEETAIKTIVKDRVLERELSTETNNEINKKIYAAIVEDQELYDYKLKKTRELMQLKADAYFKRQQKII